MNLLEQLNQDMKAALKAGEKIRLETIRSLRGLITNAEIEKIGALTEDELLQVLRQAAKKRKEAIEQYTSFGREDRARQEEQELAVIEAYLPRQMDEAEISKLAKRVIAETGANSMKDMGKVMGALMPRLQGKADGKLVQQVVRKLLSA